MREIKFRAWGKNSKEYLGYGTKDGISLTLKNIQNIEDLDSWIFEQSTGLKDKNGKEIYEGGVVKVVLFTRKGNKGRYKKDGVEEIGYIRFEEGGFKICFAKNKAGEPTSSLRLDDLRWETYGEVLDKTTWYKYDTEVIGNIHENPELLEKTE